MPAETKKINYYKFIKKNCQVHLFLLDYKLEFFLYVSSMLKVNVAIGGA